MSFLSLLALVAPLVGDLKLTARGSEPDARVVQIAATWKNGWKNARNHDALWIVMRDANDGAAATLKLAAEGHVVRGTPGARIVPAPDGTGAFIEPTEEHRGPVNWNVALQLADTVERPSAIAAWGVEMVFIPAGGFELGDDAPGVAAKGAFRDGGGGPYSVQSEAAVEVGPDAGQLHYDAGRTPQYVGDNAGPIPAAFPKGTRAFYLMKYELRQGEYARFLNALPAEWRDQRALVELPEEERGTCSVALVDGAFQAAAPRRPCNFLTWDDSAAWADWMGLRPMTELEFEKAARGPKRPMPGDFPWGSDTREGVARKVLPTRDLAAASDADEEALSDATRTRLAASYYWVHDLAGSVWERVVSAGHPAGRAFEGSHGDGLLDAGRATNADWPHQIDKDAPGIGYRGGADYFGGEPNETNPFSCVGTRQYAAWSGAYRYKTYSARAVRSAP